MNISVVKNNCLRDNMKAPIKATHGRDTKQFDIKAWQTKNTINEVRYDVRGLNDLKNNYYTISDELYDIESNIKQVLSTTEGEEWEDAKMGEGALAKELKIFGAIKKLFAKSKLGKVL